ncbi:hypothetical protein GJ744_003015 [Endocarpon pusillum]|uniref:Uncharacterized protein n=1 Tax=Endocarpon pusillum TaxID=364733 RepID=A0A8H7DYG3_9EURO|nr:hypothetical protein GJ744_003015 [Endocarpon pusillum]
MTIQKLPFLALTCFLGALASAQGSPPRCLNTLAYYNPTLRTGCFNATWFILRVPKTAVQSIVPSDYPLITPPESLFPNGFPADSHPVVVNCGYMNDIRQGPLQIQALMGAGINVPYVDRLRDGKTPFNYPCRTFIGGVNGKDISAVVPALVGSTQGNSILVASFSPNDGPYAALASSPNEFEAQVRQVILPNPISGPGIVPAAFDLDFTSASPAQYAEDTFRALINQPTILTNTKCQRNTYYFNQTFRESVMRTGDATLYGPARMGAVPAELDNRYVEQGGYSASSVMVGFNAEDCASAGANVDPNA